jgi:hypothetical protein
LGALLIALICLGGGLEHLDRLLGPTMAWFAGSLPLGLAPSRPAGGALIIASP